MSNSKSLEKRQNLAAANKKFITYQSLKIHVSQIADRQRFSEILQMLLFSQEEEQSNTDVITSQMETEQTILHRLSSLQQIKENKVAQHRYIKSSVPVRKRSQNRKCTHHRRFADNGKCFELLPTAGGPDNILHCIFGEMSRSTCSYICQNTATHRKYLSTHLQELKTKPGDTLQLEFFLKSFVKRMHFDADKDRYPVACQMLKDEDFGDIKTLDPLRNEESLRLLEEYATFIKSPSSKLDLVELEILAIAHSLIIYVYEDEQEDNYFLKLLLKKTLQVRGSGHHLEPKFIFYNNHSACWQRLEIVPKLQPFCNEIMKKQCQSTNLLLKGQPNFVHAQKNEFQTLLKWLETNYPNSEIERSIKKLASKPTNNIIAEWLKPHFETTPNEIKLLSSNISFLIERIMDENIDPIIYLYVIENFKLQEWKYEFLLLELEKRFLDDVYVPQEKGIIQTSWYDRLQLRKHLTDLNDQIFYLLWNRVVADDSSTFVPEKLQETLKFIRQKENELVQEDLQRLGQLHLNDWLGDLKCRTWEIEINQHFEMTGGDAREIISILLKLESKKGEKFCRDCIEKWKNLSILDWSLMKIELTQHIYGALTTDVGQVTLQEIISIMDDDRKNTYQMNKKRKLTISNHEFEEEKKNENWIKNLKQIEQILSASPR